MKMIPVENIPVNSHAGGNSKYETLLNAFHNGCHDKVRLDLDNEFKNSEAAYASLYAAIRRSQYRGRIGIIVRNGSIYLFKKEAS